MFLNFVLNMYPKLSQQSLAIDPILMVFGSTFLWTSYLDPVDIVSAHKVAGSVSNHSPLCRPWPCVGIICAEVAVVAHGVILGQGPNVPGT
jgi:hypothetical protein